MNKFKLTGCEKAWVLYDIGNSAFILLVSTLIPIYFNGLADAAGISSENYLAYWGYAGSIATLIVAFAAPVFGAIADRKNTKKRLFIISLLIGAFGCALLGFAPGWLSFLALFIAAKVGYSASLVFYDAMLPEITESKRMDKVSSQGYAFGYIGSCIPFIVCLCIVLFSDQLSLPIGKAMMIAFLITAIWLIVMTLPLVKRYKQTAYVEKDGNAVIQSFSRLYNTFKNIKKEKGTFLFLLAFFFYIDGVYTIIDMATAYGAALGLDTTGLLLALLLTQFVAFPCCIVFGRLSSKYETGILIKVCIIAYTAIAVFAMFLTAQWQFWVLAVLVGMFQGGIQALSRSYFAKIIPNENSGEYFGLFDICGKGATFMGTIVVSVISQVTKIENLGVGALAILFFIGFIIFCKADKLCKGNS